MHSMLIAVRNRRCTEVQRIMMADLAIGIVIVFMLSLIISQWNEKDRNHDE